MIKRLSKFIAKRYVEKHREDGKLVGLTNAAIKGTDLYLDFSKFLLGYIIFSVLYMIGLPIATFYWTDHNIWWSLLTFSVCSTIFIISTIWLVLKFFRSIKDEILTLSKTLSK